MLVRKANRQYLDQIGSLKAVWFGSVLFIPPANFVCRGYTVFTLSVRPSVRPSVRNALFP